MPEPERKAVRELVVDRMLALFTGPLVYGKGYDAAALDKALAARNGLKPGADLAARDEAERGRGRAGARLAPRAGQRADHQGRSDPQGLGAALEPSGVREMGEAAVVGEDARAECAIVPAPAGVTLAEGCRASRDRDAAGPISRRCRSFRCLRRLRPQRAGQPKKRRPGRWTTGAWTRPPLR